MLVARAERQRPMTAGMMSRVCCHAVPATSEEQKAALGKVRRKPRQYDLLTGNLVLKPPKVGRGDHIALKSYPGEKPRVPGMAHFAGTGPEGKRCQHCVFLKDIPVWGRDRMTPAEAGRKDDDPPKRIQHNACVRAADMMQGHVQPGGIQFEPACKYFENK